MPELPDVEWFKKYLDATSLHKTIQDIQCTDGRILHGLSASRLRSKLKGHKMLYTFRHGKYLFIQTDADSWLYFHFGMTGNLKFFKKENKAPQYGRVFFRLDNGFQLAYVSQRLLGQVGTTSNTKRFIKKKELGSDAQHIGWDRFRDILRGKSGSIKSALMNQKVLAGIGNIYADEILYHARIHPKTAVLQLDETKIKKIYEHMKDVIKTAVRSRADPEQFPDSYLLPHRRTDQRCPRSHSPLKQIKINSRTAYFCPRCQPQK